MGFGIGSSTSSPSVSPVSFNSASGPGAAQDPFSADVAKLMKDFQSLTGGSPTQSAPGTDAQGADSQQSQNPMQGIMQALTKMIDALQQVVQQLGSLLGGKNQGAAGQDGSVDGGPSLLDAQDPSQDAGTPSIDDSAAA